MIQWFIDNFGQYEPLRDPNTGEYLKDLASIDWTYLCCVFLFGMCLLYCFRIILAFFKGVNWK